MNTFYGFEFWRNFLLFFPVAILVFYLPGLVLLKNFRLSKFETISLGVPLGIALFAWQGFIFGYLGMRWLTYVYVIVPPIYLYFTLRKTLSLIEIKMSLTRFVKEYSLVLFLIVVGVIIQLSAIWFTAVRINGSLVLCCGNIHDNIWFGSIASELVSRFPPQQPGMSDVLLKNYHYWSNLVVAEIARIFYLPLSAIQFQYMPLLLSVLLGLNAISFGRILKLPKQYIFWLVFFLYFGSDAIYWLLFALGKGLDFSMSSLEDGARFLTNLPRSYAVILFMSGLTLYIHWVKSKFTLSIFPLVVLFSSLQGFKIYFAIYSIIGLFSSSIVFMPDKKLRPFILALVTLVLSGVGYVPVNSTAGGLYYTGFWRFEDFIVQPRLGLIRLELARVVFHDHKNYFRVFVYDMLFLLLYTLSIFGTKLLGFIQTIRSLKHFPLFLHVFLISGLAVNFVLGSFYQQTVGTSNTFNFLVVFFIVFSYYTALSCWYFISRQPSRLFVWFLTVVVMIITVPRIIKEFSQNIINIRNGGGYTISDNYGKTVEFLREKVNNTQQILVGPGTPTLDDNSPMVSFLTNKQMYLSGRGQLVVSNVDAFSRERNVDTLFRKQNNLATAKLLQNEPIDFILVSTPNAIRSTPSAQYLDVVYQNKDLVVLRVDPDKITIFLKKFYPSFSFCLPSRCKSNQ